MTVKEQVLILLENEKGAAVSGSKIAENLGCTRAAVWKAIKSLQNEGFEIRGVNNKGYTLIRSADILSSAYIEKRLDNAGISLAVRCEHSVDSTNNVLKQLAHSGETRDLCLASEEQTAGRGRQGREFLSPAGTGVYFSLLLHPHAKAADAALLTTMAATAVAQAVDGTRRDLGLPLEPAQIKWVNDVLLREKKICGILTESSFSMEDFSLEYIIVGIGINLYEPEGGFPEEIRDIAGALFTREEIAHPALVSHSTDAFKTSSGASTSKSLLGENVKNRIVSEVLIRFMEYYRDFPSAAFLDDYRAKSYVLGKEVTLLNSASHSAVSGSPGSGPDRSRATALDIDRQGHLLVRYPDGTEEYILSGEISVRV